MEKIIKLVETLSDEIFHEEYYNAEPSMERIKKAATELNKELAASRDSKLSAVPSEEEMKFTREWWVNENKDTNNLTQDQLNDISIAAAEILIKYYNYRIKRGIAG